MVNVMIVEDQKLVRSILESYIKKEEGYELLSSIPYFIASRGCSED